MTLVRWNPYRELSTMERQLNRLWGGHSLLGMGEGEKTGWDWSPAAEIVETKEAYRIDLELPGVEKENVKINLEENVLTIRGEKKNEKKAEDVNYCACERSYGSFERSFTLPTTVVNDKIEATFKNGMLHIMIPKAEQVKPKEIQIS